MAAATAPAPKNPPMIADATISSGRPERCVYAKRNRSGPISSFRSPGDERELDRALS